MQLEAYDQTQIASLISELNHRGGNWDLQDGKLTTDYKFADFNQAFGFMTRCALYIEKVDHHPEWFNVYSKVRVQLTTHEVSGISYKDADLANVMDRFAAQ
ncbi:MAG: 4a-hydroxytetrahydrobiopterin dehydratase [Candidatus Pelagadaptatus aseana]|uniref:4a-hydroxytetrahydrobiopterin dehydratase n=1 Tax=Candidatus Pelagadaptatus aseana TaxID=3120508 RepID=UPI0039B26CF6